MSEDWREANEESQAASTQVEKILEAMPSGEAEDFEAELGTMWDDLPTNAQSVIRRELA
jgi:hypothetical protein